jgi:hypothetical protein
VNDGETLDSWEVRKEKNLAKGYNGNGMGTPLTIASLQWQTPATDSFRSRSGERSGEMGLDQQARFWTMPQAHDVTMGNPERVRRFGTEHGGRNLTDDVTMWTSPQAHDGRRPGADLRSTEGGNLNREASVWPSPAGRDWKGEKGEAHLEAGTGRKHLDQLPHVFPSGPPDPETGKPGAGCSSAGPDLLPLWPTPNPPNGDRKKLNPEFVAWLMGFPAGWLEPTSCGRSAMLSYLSRGRSLLSCLLAGPAYRGSSNTGRIEV